MMTLETSLSTRSATESVNEQASGSHLLVGTVLLCCGVASLVAGALAHWATVDLHFLTPLDVMVIASAMVGVGLWQRLAGGEINRQAS